MLVETASFQLAVNAAGDERAERLALVLPGRLDSKDYAHMRSHVACLAARGFYAVSFDPPGTWQSPGDISLFTTTNYLKAVSELIDRLGRRPTLLLGHSRGGAVAALAAGDDAVYAVACAMASYGPAAAPTPEALARGYDETSRDLPSGEEADDALGERRLFRLPLEYFADSRRYDAGRALLTLSKPKLLVYGAADVFTPPERVEEIFARLPQPKTLARLECGHDYRFDARLIAAVEAALSSFVDGL